MEIIKFYRHQGDIEEISRRYRAFAKLKNATIKSDSNMKWKDEGNNSISWQALVVFVGKSGYGKSSTVNAFFGSKIMETSDVEACTRNCQSLDFKLSSGCYLSLGDLPGIGESEQRDKEYIKMYRDFLYYSSVVVYVIRADSRDYSIDEAVHKQLFNTEKDKKKIIIAMNYCDKIEPISRNMSIEPSVEQMRNITEKIDSIFPIFNPVNCIVPYSANTGWNMNRLAEEIVRVVSRSEKMILSPVSAEIY